MDDALFATYLDETFPAATLMVLHKGVVVAEAAVGWLDPEIQSYPVEMDTRFDLASLTKLFTTSAFLSLLSEDKVSLETPLVDILPAFATHNPRTMDGGQDPHSKKHLPTPPHLAGQQVDVRAVSFWHLLTHTSGLPAWRDVYNAIPTAPTYPIADDFWGRAERWERALQRLYDYPFVGHVGESVRYSDIGLMLLGEAVAQLHGAPLDQVIEERVLQPLGLKTTTFNPPPSLQKQIAPTEMDAIWRQRRCWGEVHDENACGAGGVAGHAGLFATVADVARFGEAWRSFDERLGIDPDVMQAAIRRQAQTDGEKRGLGWMIRSETASSAGDAMSFATYGHTGFTGTSLFIDPEQELVVAILTNRVYMGRDKPGIFAFRRHVHDWAAQKVAG